MSAPPPQDSILALDTGTPVASVAVVGRDDRPRVCLQTDARNHGPTLMGTIEQALELAAVRPSDLAAVACGRGPGSFTGLRIGLATAKGLCLGLGCPLVLPSSLEAMAMQVAVEAPTVVVPCLDARRRELYVAGYLVVPGEEAPRRVVLEPLAASAEVVVAQLAPLAQTAPLWLVGNGVALYRDILGEGLGELAHREDAGPSTPDAASLAALARGMIARGEIADLDSAEPEYLRLSDAELSWQKRHGNVAKEAPHVD